MGRAAQRYASVDKEDFDSHLSLSSVVSENGGKFSNRLSTRKKGGSTIKKECSTVVEITVPAQTIGQFELGKINEENKSNR